MPIKPINPIAKMMLTNRRRKQFVKPKKVKGSYERNKEKRLLEKGEKNTEEK